MLAQEQDEFSAVGSTAFSSHSEREQHDKGTSNLGESNGDGVRTSINVANTAQLLVEAQPTDHYRGLLALQLLSALHLVGFPSLDEMKGQQARKKVSAGTYQS